MHDKVFAAVTACFPVSMASCCSAPRATDVAQNAIAGSRYGVSPTAGGGSAASVELGSMRDVHAGACAMKFTDWRGDFVFKLSVQ